MERFAADLHMHSCLSPCAEEEMTPNNIVGMAYLKGLDVIAVTDHNSCRNLPALARVAEAMGVILLPGMEACTREDVHILCYFEKLEAALDFSGWLYGHLPPLPNAPEVFGSQLILNEEDEVAGTEPKLLIQSTDLSLDELVKGVDGFGGVCVAAHINRSSNSLLANLGFVPPHTPLAALEVYPNLPAPDVDTGNYKLLYSSDAHRLGDIAERSFFLNLEEKSAACLFHQLVEARKRVHGG